MEEKMNQDGADVNFDSAVAELSPAEDEQQPQMQQHNWKFTKGM